MIRRILVPLDGSQLAEGVLPTVEDLAARLGLEVFFVQVVSLSPPLLTIEPAAGTMIDPGVVEQQMEAESEAAENYLAQLARDWQARGVDARWEVVRGTPATSIVEYAHSHGLDLIAMSTHGRSGLGRLVFGSVADRVLREAGTPVLMVKPQS